MMIRLITQEEQGVFACSLRVGMSFLQELQNPNTWKFSDQF